MDFYKIVTESVGKKEITIIIKPNFLVGRIKDLMIRGNKFYAVWDEEKGLWSTDEFEVARIVDEDLFKEADKYSEDTVVKTMKDFNSGSWDMYKKYISKSPDNYHQLDNKITFANTEVKKSDYISRRLPYELKEGDYSNYDLLMSTLYDPDEREKLEWAIGAIISGDAKKIQKFIVLYGDAGAGKSTILNIIQMLFQGYYATFNAKELTSAGSNFATAAFENDPLVAIQHDGDLSGIKDNSVMNSIISHEEIEINQKFKATYTARANCFLFMATNKPVKITDAKSGLIRRLIDVKPSGRKLSNDKYNFVFGLVEYELGAIAYHCLEVYKSLGKNYYNSYKPLDMMFMTNPFFNFVEDSYLVFQEKDGISLKSAYARYKEYCAESGAEYQIQMYKFREELKNYFKVFEEDKRMEDGTHVRSYYSGFLTEKFEKVKKIEVPEVVDKADWLDLFEQESLFDKLAEDWPAQYGVVRNSNEVPNYKWNNVRTKLSDLDSSKVHYVKFPEEYQNYIVVDFDMKDSSGKKSFAKNKEAASKWPKTYAETSKSGEGIHLVYIYNGDVNQLSRIYDDDIEIKVYTGNSSLRRKLTKCNSIPIAKISSGLPLKKGDKVVSSEVINNEKHLRTLIKKNLNKEIHPGTKPSMDFINKLLNDAYDSGMNYDVSDMYQALLTFALKSTHQSDYCLKMLGEMKLKSETQAMSENNDDKPIVFYDIEVFPNLFIVNWKKEGKGSPVVRMINPSPEDMENLMQLRLVGFNCRRYDNHIIYARMMGYTIPQLYHLSQKIIKGESNCFFSEAYNVSYADIYDFASAGNKKSLKKLEIEMGIPHLELGLHWDKPVPEELWEKVAEYCDNDVIATEAAFNYLSADWTARQILADLADMTVNDTTNSLTTRIIFGKERNPQGEFCYRNLAKPVYEIEKEVKDFLEDACPEMLSVRHGEAKSILPYFEGYKFENGKSTYLGEEVGEGGRVYAEPGMYDLVVLLDIASMHPHSAIAECIFGPRFTKAFREIVEGRVSIKHQAWDEVNSMLDGKLTRFVQRVIDGKMTAGQLADALKTAINSVYGLTSAKFKNPFKDERNVDNIVAKRGALFMMNLEQEVKARGFTVAHIKTDSIKIPNATQEIIQFVMDYGKLFGYTFEHEATYEKMCLVNDAVYIAKVKSGKHAGEWSATGKQFAVPYVFKTLFSKEPIEFNDMCETFAVAKGDIFLDMNEGYPDVTHAEKELEKLGQHLKKGKISQMQYDEGAAVLKEEIATGHNYVFVGRVGQFTPIKAGANGGELYRFHEGKYYALPGSSGYRWLESEQVKQLNKEKDIDKSFYQDLVDKAIETISQYGDFERFAES